jgi:hypothetical protein
MTWVIRLRENTRLTYDAVDAEEGMTQVVRSSKGEVYMPWLILLKP